MPPTQTSPTQPLKDVGVHDLQPSLRKQAHAGPSTRLPHRTPDPAQVLVLTEVDVNNVVSYTRSHVTPSQGIERKGLNTGLVRGHDRRGEEAERLKGVVAGVLGSDELALGGVVEGGRVVDVGLEITRGAVVVRLAGAGDGVDFWS